MAKFNEVLKSKREELGLSIADISKRTRLTERYIIALENRDIQSFENDLSYLRYFVRSYCDAVDISYDTVREDVQEAVEAFAQEKEIALTQTHTDIENHIQQAESLTKVDKNQKERKQRNLSSMTQHGYNRMDASFLSFVAIVLVVLIVIVFALIVFLNSRGQAPQNDSNLDTTPPIQENQDVGNADTGTDAETPTEKKEMKIEKTGTTTYTVSNVYKGDVLKFTVIPGGGSAVELQVDGKAVAEKQIYYSSQPYEYELTVEKSCQVTINDGYMYNNVIKINDQTLEIDSSIKQGSSAEYTIQIEMVE
ncbi:helix-turn-helix domain-containing protein [Merdibacter massiliensis]|uniref:helix-turn-helix domain-containing protein n=1 Tax=Merdibacter massiliensis TaxID=1871030 RepID=UPI00096AC327|nr:helix-turn-helix domain-containing protein [Merdibacter massiliensis]